MVWHLTQGLKVSGFAVRLNNAVSLGKHQLFVTYRAESEILAVVATFLA